MKLSQKKLRGRDEAVSLVQEHLSPRAHDIRELERWYQGKQYEELPDWFTAENTPLFERGPCIVYPFARSAISSHVDLVMGEGRFPLVSVGSQAPDSPFDDERPLSEDEQSLVDRFVAEVSRQSRFENVARRALMAAMSARSACLLFGVRNGKLFVDLVKSRWCEPELGDEGEVKRLVVEYPFTQDEQDPDGSWHLRAYLFRRVIDDQSDVTYQPAALRKGMRSDAIEWVRDESRSHDHNLGFCPVVWYPFDKGCDVEGRVDGYALHEDLLDEIYALDFTLSLRHRAGLFAGEPQWVLQGIDAETVIGATGRKPQAVPASRFGGEMTGDNPMAASYQLESAGPANVALKKGADKPWRMPAGSKAELIALAGSALDALSDHARDLRIKLAEAAAVVFLDPGDIQYAAALSGKALETLRGRQLSRCDQIRIDVEDGLVLPSLRMLLRIVATLGDRVRVPGLSQALPLLQRFNEGTKEIVPDLRATWPPYFDIDHQDIEAVSSTVRQDLDAGIITRRTAVQKLADWYDIDDLDSYLESLEEERAEKASQLHKTMLAMASDDDDGDTDPSASGPDPERGGAARGPESGGRVGQARAGRGGGGGAAGNAGPPGNPPQR